MISNPTISAGRQRIMALFGDSEIRMLFLAYFGLFVVTDAFQQAVPLYFDALGISSSALGVGLAVANAAEALLSPVAGVLSDRHDRLMIAFICGIGLAVLLAIFGFVTGPVQLIVLLVGISGFKLLFSNSIAPAFNEALDDEGDGFGWGVRDVSIYLGGAVGLAFGGIAVSLTNSVATVFFLLSLVLVPVSLGLYHRGDSSVMRDINHSRLFASITDLELLDAYRGVSSWSLLGRFLVIEMLVGIGMGMSLVFLPVFATEVATTPEGFLLVFSLSSVFAAPMSLLGGILTDRYSRKWLYVANFATETVMLAAFAVTQDFMFLIIGIGMYVIQTTFEPAVVSYFFDQFDEEEGGRVWSIKGTIAKTTGIVGPALGGVIYATSPHGLFTLGAIFTGLGTIAALTLPS